MTQRELLLKFYKGEFKLGTIFECRITGKNVKYGLYTGINPEKPDEVLTNAEALIDLETNTILEISLEINDFFIKR